MSGRDDPDESGFPHIRFDRKRGCSSGISSAICLAFLSATPLWTSSFTHEGSRASRAARVAGLTSMEKFGSKSRRFPGEIFNNHRTNREGHLRVGYVWHWRPVNDHFVPRTYTAFPGIYTKFPANYTKVGLPLRFSNSWQKGPYTPGTPQSGEISTNLTPSGGLETHSG